MQRNCALHELTGREVVRLTGAEVAIRRGFALTLNGFVRDMTHPPMTDAERKAAAERIWRARRRTA